MVFPPSGPAMPRIAFVTAIATLHRDEDAEDDLGINLGESLAADGGHASGAKRAPKPAPAS